MIVGEFYFTEFAKAEYLDFAFDPRKRKIKKVTSRTRVKTKEGIEVILYEDGFETGPKILVPLPEDFPPVLVGDRHFVTESELTIQRVEDKLLLDVMRTKCYDFISPHWIVDEETRKMREQEDRVCFPGKKELSESERDAIRKLAEWILEVLTSEKLRKISMKRFEKIEKEIQRRIEVMREVPREWCEQPLIKCEHTEGLRKKRKD